MFGVSVEVGVEEAACGGEADEDKADLVGVASLLLLVADRPSTFSRSRQNDSNDDTLPLGALLRRLCEIGVVVEVEVKVEEGEEDGTG